MMDGTKEFPTFDCMITNAAEDYDSGIWEFFRQIILIESDLGILIHADGEWKHNYARILQYISDLGSSIILKRDPPDSSFLGHLNIDKQGDVDEADVLLRSKDNVPGLLIRTAAELETLMALYIRVSRTAKFSGCFSDEKFQAFKLISEILFKRGIKRSEE